MSGIVVFSYAGWIARYGEFAAVSPETAQAYFNEATLYHRNDGLGPVTTETAQLALLNMVTAHIAARYAALNSAGQATGAAAAANSTVGRINSASEGSVSVQTEFDSTAKPMSMAWWNQTKYGADYWLATAPYRTARYLPNLCGQRNFNPWPNQ